MKRWMTTLLLAVVCTVCTWAQAQKTFIKSIALEGQNHVVAAFQGDVTTSKWDNNYMRVTVTVEVSNFGEEILKRLVEVGRYDIQTATDANGSLLLTMPKIAMPVNIQGKALVEKLRYEVSLPKNVVLDVRGQENNTAVGSVH